MANTATMSFPTLSEEELINLGKEMLGPECSITLAVFRQPTMETTLNMFRLFVRDILNLDLDLSTVIPFNVMSGVQYFETHQGQASVTRLYAAVRTLLKWVHYDSFTIEDLMHPRPKRLRRQLSALANYALHLQRMREEYADDVLEKTEEEILYTERVVNENKALKSNIHKDMEREDQLKAEERQRRGAIDEHSQEISALHDQKEQLARDTKQARAEIAGLEDRLSQEAVEDAKLNEERTSLESQLVGSPEKVRHTLTRTQEELQTTEEQRRAASERLQDLRSIRQQSEKLSQELERLQQRVSTLRDLAESQREDKTKIADVTKAMETCRLEASELRSSTRQLADRCQMIEESREGQMQMNERYIKNKDDELQKRERVREETRSRLAADQQQAAQLATQRQRLDQRAEQEADQYQRQLDALQQQGQQLVEAVEWVKTESDRIQNELLAMIDNGE